MGHISITASSEKWSLDSPDCEDTYRGAFEIITRHLGAMVGELSDHLGEGFTTVITVPFSVGTTLSATVHHDPTRGRGSA